MTLQEQIQNNATFVGVVVALLVLAMLILVIRLFARIRHRPSRPDDAGGTGIRLADADFPAEDGDESKESVSRLEDGDESKESVSRLEDGDEPEPELMAVIMAALSVAMGQPEFRLRSIRRTGRTTPAWNLSGRDEYLATRL